MNKNNSNNDFPCAKIIGLQFSILSPDEIRNFLRMGRGDGQDRAFCNSARRVMFWASGKPGAFCQDKACHEN